MVGMDGMVHTPGFGDETQSASELDFGTPSNFNIDAMMRGGDVPNLGNYSGAQMNLPPGYGNVFDPSLVPQDPLIAGQMRHHPAMGNVSGPQSHNIGGAHRLSANSAGQYSGNDAHAETGSENTSPDATIDNFMGNRNGSAMPQAKEDKEDEEHDDDLRPSWSELKTKAGKERKRLPLACIACRRKKIRCSGEKPACKHCLRSRIPCVYKVTTRKAAPRTDYMAMLDKRLKRMEERVIKVIPKEEQGIVATTGRAVVKPPLPSAPTRTASATKKRAAEAAFADELDQWAGVKESIHGNADPAPKDKETGPLKVQEIDEHNLLREGSDKLPTKELQEHLSEVFFDYVYCQSYPLLHKPSFLRKLAQDQVPPVLMLAVCAISARFSTHPEVRTEPAFLRGEEWASAAREIALSRYDTPNLTILIVYLILGLHEFGTCQGGRSWMFGGMAQRMAYALQLHRDLDHDPKSRKAEGRDELTFTDREIRRRTMWSCFLMDRFSSSGTERPIFISEQYIRAQLPIKESYFQMEITGPTEDLEGNVPNPMKPGTGELSDAKDNMGVCAYLIRLVAIWGRLINYMNQGGKQRDKFPMWDEKSTFQLIKQDARKWQESLPESLAFTPENLQNHASEKIANQFIFLHLVYSQINLFVNRFALPAPGTRSKAVKNAPPEFLADASRAALDAANQLSKLIYEALDHQVVAPFAGYCAFYSSTVHIYGAFSNNPTLEASSKQNLACNIKYLTKMKKYWGMFHFVTENLRDLYRKHADAAKLGHKPGAREAGDQNIFQYGDWFDRYPHGVSGTDYEEPSLDVKKEPGADAVLGQKGDLQTVEEFFAKLSPPSAAVSKGQPQQQTRKMAKRRNTKTGNRPASSQNQSEMDVNNTAPQQVGGQAPQNFASGMHGVSQPAPAFAGDAMSGLNPMMMQPNQQFLSQLDRQMVLDSYAGVNSASMAPTTHPMLDMHDPLPLDNYDFASLSHTNSNTSPGGMFGDDSTAWFMPFNMEPPAGGEEGNFFGNIFDWTNMANLGDVPVDLQGTGLTPGRDGNGDLMLGAEPDGRSRSQLDDLR